MQYVLSSTYIRQLHITSAAYNQLYSKHQMMFTLSSCVLLKASIDQGEKIKGLTGMTKCFVQTEHQKHKISDSLRNKGTYGVAHEHPSSVTTPFIHVLMALHAMNKPFLWQITPSLKSTVLLWCHALFFSTDNSLPSVHEDSQACYSMVLKNRGIKILPHNGTQISLHYGNIAHKSIATASHLLPNQIFSYKAAYLVYTGCI